jgi:peptidoglycan/LPS O-acetylase OafA/YrhL
MRACIESVSPIARRNGSRRLIKMDMSSVETSASQSLGNELSAGVAANTKRVRGDIEGLRAIAVLTVIVHHAFPLALPGGFAGVDIFFVISGYLIGRRLLQDIQIRRFSVREFYARRARRIFPALFFLLIAIWIVGWLAFPAPEYADLGRQIAAATLFSNNILLWTQSGYFDVPAIDKPLLHLWSLGIEEQFYLIVPVLLWLSTIRSMGSIRWVARLGALSLLTTVLLSNLEYPATFYLLHTRFWELAGGVVLAQAELRLTAGARWQQTLRAASGRYSREILIWSIALMLAAVLQFGFVGARRGWERFPMDSGSALVFVVGAATAILADLYARPEKWNRLLSWALRNQMRLAAASSAAGILLVCAAVVAFGSADWPGAQTMFPVLGAAMVIAAGRASAPNRFLGIKPLVFVGGISYPLYLWHWPVIVLWRQLNPGNGTIGMVMPLLVSIVLAWTTQELVEKPVRFGKLGVANIRRPPLWPVISGLVLAALLGVAVNMAGGLPARYPPQLRAIADWSDPNPYAARVIDRCHYYGNASSEFTNGCTPVKRNGLPLVLVWGDSHAAHLYPGLADIQSNVKFDIVQWTAAGCAPTMTAVVGETNSCAELRATTIAKLGQIDPDVVLLGGAWERYQELGRKPQEILGLVAETINYLKSKGTKRIVIFGPGPLWISSLPVDLFRFMVRTRADEIPQRLGKVSDAIWRLDAAMAAQAAAANVRYVSVVHDLCDPSGCQTVGDRTLPRPDLLYRDRDHLTPTGSRVLLEQSRSVLFGGS